MPGIDDFKSDMAIVKSEIVYLRKDVNRMLELLLDNPDHAVAPRLKVLEKEALHIQDRFDEMESRSWQMKLSITSSVLAFLLSIVLLILEINLKKPS